MQFILALTAALVSATVVSGAAAPAARQVAVPGFININDFQGKGLNLVNDAPAPPTEGTAVIGFPVSFSSQLNQEWTLLPKGSNFTIANALVPSLQLSYPTAQFGGNTHFAGLIVSAKFPATFSIQASGSGVQIIEVTSGQALTSWPSAAGQSQSPVTLNFVSGSLKAQQTWTLVPSS